MAAIPLFDEYEFRARLLPMLSALSPLILLPYALFPETVSLLGVLAGVVGGLGLTRLLSAVSRDRGRQIQAKLFKQWGGMPSTRFLRHADHDFNRVTKLHIHAHFRSLGFNVPVDVLDEANDQEGADAVYEAIGARLRRVTRSKKEYPLVFAENAAFGFSRNAYGIKRLAVCASVLALIIEGCAFYYLGVLTPLFLVVVALQIFIGGFWLFAVTPSMVRRNGESYARALLECWADAK